MSPKPVSVWGTSLCPDTGRKEGEVHGKHRICTRQHSDQSLTRQLDELHAHGCERVFAEAASGQRGAHRPQWESCLAHLRAGDTLVLVALSRLGRNTGDLGRLLDDLDERGIELKILNLGVDTKTPAGRLIFTIVACETRSTDASATTCGRYVPQPG